MKTIQILIIIGLAVILTACHQSDKSIAGVYVMNFKNEYSVAHDTLVIQSYSLSVGTYQVERRDGYQRIREGKILPKAYRQERWMATFDRARQILSESAYGRQIYIRDDGRTLSYGGSYQKVN